MADPGPPSSPGDDVPLEEGSIRWPALAGLGLIVAVVTLVALIAAVVVAVFVVGPRDDAEESAPQARTASIQR